MATQIKSRKAKARRLQNYVSEKIAEAYNLSFGKDKDVQGREMGQSGVDVRLSPKAKEIVPFDIEVKAVERLNLWSAIKQAEENTEEGRIPLLVFRRNRGRVYCALPFNDFLGYLDKKR